MDQAPGDLESAGAILMLDDFSLKAPKDAVQWLLGQVMEPPKTRSDEVPPALKFVTAFTKSSYKRKQAIVVHLVKGFATLPAPERVKITLIIMRVMEAISALQLRTAQNEQVERSAPEQTRPLAQIPDLKQVIDLIKTGAIDVETVGEMLQAVPPDQRGSIVEAVKAAAEQQGLGQEDLTFLTQIAEKVQQPTQDVTPKAGQDPEAEATQSWSKLALMLKIAEELQNVPGDERPHLAQAAKVAVLQSGILKVIRSIIELITELRYPEDAEKGGLDERKQLELLIDKQLRLRKDDVKNFYVHRALSPGGYADQLLAFSGVLLFAYDYAWAFAALPLIELMLACRSTHCPVPLFPWLRADAILWFITAGTSFRIFLEYCRVYTKYQETEEDKLAKGQVPASDETERGTASSDLQLIYSFVDETTIWKLGMFAGLLVLSLLAGWTASLVAFCEIFVCLFKSCGFFTILLALFYDLLRVTSFLIVLNMLLKLYQEYRAIPAEESSLSTAAAAENYGSFEDPDKPAVPVFRG